MNTSTGLNRKLTFLLLTVLVLTSLVFFILFWFTYHSQLRDERSEASRTVNQLLQASLENSMLKRDIPGLHDIVERLSQQPEIRDVVILNPKGEVRFSGNQRNIGSPFEQPLADICPNCVSNPSAATPRTTFISDREGYKILRSVNPVPNRSACLECHGSVSLNPINGILLVDYDAGPIIKKARSGLAALAVSGLIVTFLTSLIVWRFMRINVLKPIRELSQTSQKITLGNLQSRADINSNDEFAELGRNFNQMTHRLNSSLHQLIEKEHFLQALIDAIPDGIRIIDSNYKIIQANRGYRTLLGKGNTPTGKFCHQHSHQRTSPCPPTLCPCPVHEIRKKGQAIKTMQQFTQANGQSTNVQVFAAPLDVTVQGKRKRFVVESIRDLAHDLQFSHKQKLSELGELAAGVVHEIRNPLASIRLALQVTTEKLQSKHANLDELRGYLKLVDGEINKCISVSQSLLKLTSLPGEKPQLVEINTAITETMALLHYEAEKADIDIQLDLPKTTPRIIAAEYEIRMLVLNLAQNAFHAMPDGGKITISAIETPEAIEMQFQDNGPGIEAKIKPYIFDPFFSHRADGVAGPGLGLTICKSIIERYQGSIQAQAIKPHGACFFVSLPSALKQSSERQ